MELQLEILRHVLLVPSTPCASTSRIVTMILASAIDGVLPRIIRRMRGLQTLHMTVENCWEIKISGKRTSHTVTDWLEIFAQGFSLLVSIELGHIKSITMSSRDDDHIVSWIGQELETRNKSWGLPSSPYKKYRRTTTSMSILDVDVIKKVAEEDDEYKPVLDECSPQALDKEYGGFDWPRPI